MPRKTVLLKLLALSVVYMHCFSLAFSTTGALNRLIMPHVIIDYICARDKKVGYGLLKVHPTGCLRSRYLESGSVMPCHRILLDLYNTMSYMFHQVWNIQMDKQNDRIPYRRVSKTDFNTNEFNAMEDNHKAFKPFLDNTYSESWLWTTIKDDKCIIS